MVFLCRGEKIPVPLPVQQGDTQVSAVKPLHIKGPRGTS